LPFDPTKRPPPVTIGALIRDGMKLEVHCRKCAKFALLDPAGLGFAPGTAVPSLQGRFKCTRCGSKETEARPHF
jgi:Zn finger protein HypA/HybF involved in hydrogenase expression